VIWVGKSDYGLMLPAVSFIVRFSQFDAESGKTNFANQGFNLGWKQPNFFITLPQAQTIFPLQSTGVSSLSDKGGFTSF
ncbi:hypothetical protein LIZ57_14655, partial [Eggerthella lenta]